MRTRNIIWTILGLACVSAEASPQATQNWVRRYVETNVTPQVSVATPYLPQRIVETNGGEVVTIVIGWSRGQNAGLRVVESNVASMTNGMTYAAIGNHTYCNNAAPCAMFSGIVVTNGVRISGNPHQVVVTNGATVATNWVGSVTNANINVRYTVGLGNVQYVSQRLMNGTYYFRATYGNHGYFILAPCRLTDAQKSRLLSCTRRLTLWDAVCALFVPRAYALTVGNEELLPAEEVPQHFEETPESNPWKVFKDEDDEYIYYTYYWYWKLHYYLDESEADYYAIDYIEVTRGTGATQRFDLGYEMLDAEAGSHLEDLRGACSELHERNESGVEKSGILDAMTEAGVSPIMVKLVERSTAIDVRLDEIIADIDRYVAQFNAYPCPEYKRTDSEYTEKKPTEEEPDPPKDPEPQPERPTNPPVIVFPHEHIVNTKGTCGSWRCDVCNQSIARGLYKGELYELPMQHNFQWDGDGRCNHCVNLLPGGRTCGMTSMLSALHTGWHNEHVENNKILKNGDYCVCANGGLVQQHDMQATNVWRMNIVSDGRSVVTNCERKMVCRNISPAAPNPEYCTHYTWKLDAHAFVEDDPVVYVDTNPGVDDMNSCAVKAHCEHDVDENGNPMCGAKSVLVRYSDGERIRHEWHRIREKPYLILSNGVTNEFYHVISNICQHADGTGCGKHWGEFEAHHVTNDISLSWNATRHWRMSACTNQCGFVSKIDDEPHQIQISGRSYTFLNADYHIISNHCEKACGWPGVLVGNEPHSHEYSYVVNTDLSHTKTDTCPTCEHILSETSELHYYKPKSIPLTTADHYVAPGHCCPCGITTHEGECDFSQTTPSTSGWYPPQNWRWSEAVQHWTKTCRRCGFVLYKQAESDESTDAYVFMGIYPAGACPFVGERVYYTNGLGKYQNNTNRQWWYVTGELY